MNQDRQEPGAATESSETAHILAVHGKLHAGKLGMHWLWGVIEQVAAGIPEDEALRGYAYALTPATESSRQADVLDAKRYRAFFDAGLPVTFCGINCHSKAELDAAIDAAMAAQAGQADAKGGTS